MRTAFACREFTDEPVTDEDLVGLLELARFAPSGGNRQGWRVVVVRDQATKDELVELSLPALRLYVVQRAAGENPWNTIVPSAIDPASIDHRDDSGVDWFRVLARAPVLLVVGVDLSVVASADSQLDRIGVISGGSIYPFVQNLLLAARRPRAGRRADHVPGRFGAGGSGAARVPARGGSGGAGADRSPEAGHHQTEPPARVVVRPDRALGRPAARLTASIDRAASIGRRWRSEPNALRRGDGFPLQAPVSVSSATECTGADSVPIRWAPRTPATNVQM